MIETTQKALELSSQYGIVAVAFFLMAIFLGSLVFYVLRQNERRENLYFALVTKEIKDIEISTAKRHDENQVAMSKLAEADRRQRDEHEKILENQKTCVDQHQKISNLLDTLLNRIQLSK